MSIKLKFNLIMLGVTAITLTLVCSAFVWLAHHQFREEVRKNMEIQAAMLGVSAAGALDFEDETAAQEALNGLQHSPTITCGALYIPDEGGPRLFAKYERLGAQVSPPDTPPNAELFSGEALETVNPVLDSETGRELGVVYLQFDHQIIVDFMRRSVIAAAVTGFGILLVVVPLASRFQRAITSRLIQLWETAQKVSKDKDYTVRAPGGGKDEIGQLISGFNEMLERIQSRDNELLKHHETLEAEVEKRTHELRELNEDLTEAKDKAETEKKNADEANESKSRFLANMSHELRTPLNAIIGYSEMLKEEAEDLAQPGLIPDLDKIHSSGHHLLGLINDILDLSKIEAGKMTLFLEEFEVDKLVGDVSATVVPLMEKNGNQLKVECAHDIGRMRADSTKVRQLLFNLLSNAAKFTEHGTITLIVAAGKQPSEESSAGDSVIQMSVRKAVSGILAGGRFHIQKVRGDRAGADDIAEICTHDGG
jgi:signal transduction histidine kinase